ncbi:glycosyltransferase [Acetatifactor muris]|uniref:PGL/p-HBAD biosynthesis glycosyltransferase/MT3031 n=1 Tax=Acetatifactor muris TaxID=879566 RepID=A0A2K4ZNQ5_9FIRM|nr:glycosyltransferase [Acetatifactor muris]MCR2050452.1 glycosyltransferase [Acetatifactor muris]SOY32080.1 PGL/p-HBAD biosynthesis glycosyltransferase/MT3031 [Acetatifactor muris]
MKFSVITVCLNPGEKLNATLESVLSQSCPDVEIVLKDGCSTDGSVENWQRENASRPEAERVKVYTEKDSGIYDAMNQAVAHAEGEFLLFLNCGDVLPEDEVLERTRQVLEQEKKAGTDMDRLVLYGDTCSGKNHVTIASAPVISGFTCYRNIPCHQSCFYSAALCREKPYDLQYKIRADYDHFLWCFYKAGAKMRHMDFPVAFYEGRGFSESPENQKRDKQEHRRITSNYMSRRELFKYRGAMIVTLAPLRRAMAESKLFSGVYHWVKKRIYSA